MLVLSRKVGGTIRIGHDVVIQVMAIKGNRISIGIKAPMDIEVHRDEVYQQMYPEGKPLDSQVESGYNGSTEIR